MHRQTWSPGPLWPPRQPDHLDHLSGTSSSTLLVMTWGSTISMVSGDKNISLLTKLSATARDRHCDNDTFLDCGVGLFIYRSHWAAPVPCQVNTRETISPRYVALLPGTRYRQRRMFPWSLVNWWKCAVMWSSTRWWGEGGISIYLNLLSLMSR